MKCDHLHPRQSSGRQTERQSVRRQEFSVIKTSAPGVFVNPFIPFPPGTEIRILPIPGKLFQLASCSFWCCRSQFYWLWGCDPLSHLFHLDLFLLPIYTVVYIALCYYILLLDMVFTSDEASFFKKGVMFKPPALMVLVRRWGEVFLIFVENPPQEVLYWEGSQESRDVKINKKLTTP